MTAIEELRKLPLDERRKIVDALEQSIREEEVDAAETPELIAELNRRYREYLENPSSAIPMEEAFNRIRSGRD